MANNFQVPKMVNMYNGQPKCSKLFTASSMCNNWKIPPESIPKANQIVTTQQIILFRFDIFFLFKYIYDKKGDVLGILYDYVNQFWETDNVSAYFNRGIQYDQMGNNIAALSDYNKAIELNPSDPFAWYNAGIAQQQIGNKTKAKNYLLKAKSLNYPVPEAVINSL